MLLNSETKIKKQRERADDANYGWNKKWDELADSIKQDEDINQTNKLDIL